MNLLTLKSITAALAATAGPSVLFNGTPREITIQANFTYGSGGTSVDAYVQSSVDNGVTWFDIANFHFTTSSAIRQFNLVLVDTADHAKDADQRLARGEHFHRRHHGADLPRAVRHDRNLWRNDKSERRHSDRHDADLIGGTCHSAPTSSSHCWCRPNVLNLQRSKLSRNV